MLQDGVAIVAKRDQRRRDRAVIVVERDELAILAKRNRERIEDRCGARVVEATADHQVRLGHDEALKQRPARRIVRIGRAPERRDLFLGQSQACIDEDGGILDRESAMGLEPSVVGAIFLDGEIAILEIEGGLAAIEDRLAQRFRLFARSEEIFQPVAEHRPAHPAMQFLEQRFDPGNEVVPVFRTGC